MGTVVVGDLHLIKDSDNHIKHEQSKKFMDWFSGQSFNNSSNKCLFLGDLAEYNIDYETLCELFVWIKGLKFKEIIWVQGNHDTTPSDSLLNAFKTIKNLKLVRQPEIYRDEDISKTYLLLPHYDFEGTSFVRMEDRYSNLYKEEEFSINFDYGFGHIMDHTQFGTDNCNISKLKVGMWLNGHVHTGNFKEKGNYLGSVIKNSSTEKDDNKFIAFITEDECKFIAVPNFMDYISCEYGEFPEVKTPLVLFQINNAPTKFDAIKTYTEHYKNIEIGFTKVLTQRSNMLETKTKVDVVDENQLFDEFAKEKELSNSVISICKKVL